MKKVGIVVVVLLLLSCIPILISCGETPTTPTEKPVAPTATATSTPESKPIIIKYSYSTPPTGWTAVRLHVPLGDMIEEATNGRVHIDHYPSESLHPHAQAYDSAVGGVADITWASVSYMRNTFPLNQAVYLPFVNLPEGNFEGEILGEGEINSVIYQDLYETVPEVREEWDAVTVLFVHKSSAFYPFTVDKPVSTLEDLKGLKMIASPGNATEMFKALGATPINLAVGDWYSAIERGIADGVNFAWAGMDSYNLFEVTSYWIDLGTTAAAWGVIINSEKWNSLPADIQQAIMTVGGIPGARFGGVSAWPADEKQVILDKVLAEGQTCERVELKPGEREKMIQAGGQPIWDKWVNDNEAKGIPAQKVLDEQLRLNEKYRIP